MNRHQTEQQLDQLYQQIDDVILSRQHPISGLLPASTAVNAHGDYTDAWVRDNVYSIMAVWGLALAYRKLDRNQGRAYLLEQSVVKLMRGLLVAQMKQANKVESFKYDQNAAHALHAKYDTQSGDPVVGDHDWGHLQLDATSLYLLMLAQMTASGLRIIFTLDEVAFIQNLVHYIGRAYRTPDYGIWERGHKINVGLRELNASSIGMAKAALESIRGLNLFGPEGGTESVVVVVADEIARTRSTLNALLPRESRSKEVDAALLSIIAFPAFAVDDADLVEQTRNTIIDKLQGRYGCKRFLLDGHQTVLENSERLHYEAHELKRFEHIESEWPLFFTYLLLDALFRGDAQAISEYSDKLESLAIIEDGHALLPELYYVPQQAIEAEKAAPHSQTRLANQNVPLVWAQSLYYLGQLLQQGLLDISDIDPLGRHRRIGRTRSTCIQIALIAENDAVQQQLLDNGVVSETVAEVAPIQIRSAVELAEALSLLGKNDKLKLSGRPPRRIRSLTTSQVFHINGNVVIFLPEFLNQNEFYLNYDNRLVIEQLKNELSYHQRHWDMPGRPLILLKITSAMLHPEGLTDLLKLTAQLQQGEVNGIPVRSGRLTELMTTATKKRLAYLDGYHFSTPAQSSIDQHQHRYLKWDAIKARPTTASQEQALNAEANSAELLKRLAYSDNPYQQIKLLDRLVRLLGLDHITTLGGETGASVRDLIEETYQRAVLNHLWSVVRQAAALLDKHDSALEDAITELLVKQKLVDVGRSYTTEALIREPLSNAQIVERIKHYGGDDRRQHVITEEIVIALGNLIKAEPSLFEHILTLRIRDLLTLLINKIANEYRVNPGEAFEIILQLRPFEIQNQLHGVLAGFGGTLEKLFSLEVLHYQGKGNQIKRVVFQQKNDPDDFGDHKNWRSWREHNGVLARMPDSFFAAVWKLLGACRGIVIGDRYERSNFLDTELHAATTANEQEFAHRVEQLLNRIKAPEYRYASIEALVTLAAVFQANPDLKLNDEIVLDVIIGHAVRQAWLDAHPAHEAHYEQHKAHAWNAYYLMPPHETARVLMEAFIFLLSPANGTAEGKQSAEELAS